MAIIALHPGEHLAEELDALNVSAAELARKMAVPTNRVRQILNGARGITGAQFWLNLQTLYDLRVAQQKSGKSVKTLPTLKRSEPVRA
jgi:antitoxin HigA-1